MFCRQTMIKWNLREIEKLLHVFYQCDSLLEFHSTIEIGYDKSKHLEPQLTLNSAEIVIEILPTLNVQM